MLQALSRHPNGREEQIVFTNLSMLVWWAASLFCLRLPFFPSNSLDHDEVGGVCNRKVETAIGRFRLLLQKRRRVSRPPWDIPKGALI